MPSSCRIYYVVFDIPAQLGHSWMMKPRASIQLLSYQCNIELGHHWKMKQLTPISSTWAFLDNDAVLAFLSTLWPRHYWKMKQLASIHLLCINDIMYFYRGVLGWWSHMLLSYCLFILSRLGAAQYLAFRLRCNWNASTLAAFSVGLQRFALLGSVHRSVFRGWKAATLVFPLWRVFMCVYEIH